jgi:thiol:disulfide interchange protein DsbD
VRPAQRDMRSIKTMIRAACLALLLPVWQAQAAGSEFLAPEQAFRISARQAQDGKSVEVRFEIAPGYYMYRERLGFGAAPEGTAITPLVPPGQIKYDATFEKNVEIYHDSLVIPIALAAAGAESKLSVTSQGCAEKGLCYPPRTDDFKVEAAGGHITRVSLLTADPSPRRLPWLQPRPPRPRPPAVSIRRSSPAAC